MITASINEKIKKNGAQFYKGLKTWSENYIRALKASGAINNGNIDIAELVTLWETIFQVDLKEAYHKFGDITNRKKRDPRLPQQTHPSFPPLDHRQNGPLERKTERPTCRRPAALRGGAPRSSASRHALLIRVRPATV